MMAEFSWTQMLSSVTLMLQLIAAAECCEFILREGGEVTLSCENAKDDQDECNRTTWLFNKQHTKAAEPLFEHGEIHKKAQTKSDRLSVTADCSLVIKKVTAEDAGRYTCRRFNTSGEQQGSDIAADLCVVNVTEHKDDNTLKLTCSVTTNKECQRYTVKWLDEESKDLTTSVSACSASVTFTTSDHIYTSEEDEFLKCQVTFDDNVQEFTFRIQSAQKMGWWMFAVVALGLAALVTGVVIAIRWMRAKGNKLQKNENAELNLNCAGTPSAAGTIQDSADPEDAVLYTSIKYTKNTNSEAQVPGKDDDDEHNEAVTYSILKPPTSSFGASTDS